MIFAFINSEDDVYANGNVNLVNSPTRTSTYVGVMQHPSINYLNCT